ncbi:hypothetical protein PMALA_079140, partial [Plasmodium malariae]
SELYKSQDENYKHSNKLNIRNYRLLSKCKHNKDTFILGLNEVNSNNGMNEKKDIYNNEHIFAKLKRKPNRSSSNNMEFSKKGKKNKSCIFETKKYSRMEKKIFKELNYLDFLKNNRTIRVEYYCYNSGINTPRWCDIFTKILESFTPMVEKVPFWFVLQKSCSSSTK